MVFKNNMAGNEKMNILYLAPIAFDYLKQRPQYLAEELAKKHRVYYVEPTASFLTDRMNDGLDYRGRSCRVTDSLQVIRLRGILSLPYKLKKFDLLQLFIRYEAAQIKKMHVKFDLLWIGYSGRYDLARRFHGIPMVYDLMDDSMLLTPDRLTRSYIAWAERHIRKEAQMILVSARQLYEQIRKKRGHVYLLQNALPESYRGNYTLPAEKAGRRKFLYVGTIAEWFDYGSVACMARTGNCTIQLVGPVLGKKVHLDHVSYTGKVPKEEVASFIAESDICIYPFQGEKLLDTINPVKIYEYLAFNKPVIAKRSKETEQLRKYIYLYTDEKELRDILRSDLKPPFASEEEYDRFISRNTWSYRAGMLDHILSSCLNDS